MSLSYRLGSTSLFDRTHESFVEPKRVVFLSLEGTKTEKNYFAFIEKYKEQLGIDAIVHIEVLLRHDTNSDPESVVELLEEYLQLRKNGAFENITDSLDLKDYSTDFIKSYLEDPNSLSAEMCRKFKSALQKEHIDLLYLNFLSKYCGDDDAFGVVIDRDCGSHSIEQMNRVIEKCREKNWGCYITNPCFEFWLLLHVSDVASEYLESLENIRQNKLDEKKNSFVSNLLYSKTGQRKTIQEKVFRNFYLPNIGTAVQRAKNFASSDSLVEEIGSNLWELLELLQRNNAP